jgi:hypothetical protein
MKNNFTVKQSIPTYINTAYIYRQTHFHHRWIQTLMLAYFLYHPTQTYFELVERWNMK